VGSVWTWGGGVGLVVTLLLLAWALHGVDPHAVLRHIARADPLWFAAAVVLATATFPVRALRWRVILRPAQGGRFAWLPLWHATAVGFMANNLLPARAGEFARGYMAQRQLPVRLTTALASIGVERVFDGLTMVGLLAIAIAAPSFPRHAAVGGISLARVATWGGVVFGALLVVALLVVSRPAWWLARLAAGLHAVLPTRAADRLAHLAEGVIAGLAVLTSPGRFATVLVWSLALWLVNASAFVACFRAFGLAVPPAGALLLQGLIGFGVALPSSPGFFGPFEAVTRATLAVYGVGADRAVSYAVAYHVGGFVPITLLGLYSLSRAHVRLGELRRPEAAAEG
jgi:glycosyltransferase 2 family protein